MGGAAKSRFALIFLTILTLGVSLGLPAEDVLDAVYDESETLPFETASQFPDAEEQLRAGEPQPVTKRDSVSRSRCFAACRERQSLQTNSPVHPAKDSLILLSHPLPLRC